MKKLLGILVLGLLFMNPAHSKVGKGNFQMSPEVLKYFIEYLRNEYATTFVVSSDGKFATYAICGAKMCTGVPLLKDCKKETGSKCYIFAQRKKKKKIIRWNKVDYIFPSEYWNYNEMVNTKYLKSHGDGIKKEISDNDIIDVLNKFGFISENLALKQTKTETKETKKKKNWITKKEPKKKKKTETTQTQQVAKKENKKEDNPLTEEDLENMQPSQSKLEAIIEFFKESVENKTPIDPDASALQFGYKDFEEFAKEYLKIFELTNISINEIREYLAGTDETVIIDQSQENLDKLYSLILNDKYFKKKNIYFKTFKKGKYGESQVDVMALAVYINYEKEMAKITKNPNLKKISRFTWDWGWSRGAGYAPYSYALEGCEKDAKKYKLFGGECLIVDWRSKVTGEIKNMLKPNLELAKRMEELKKQKLKPKKEKKKEIAKVKVQTEKPKSTVDLIIPVQVYIIQVNEKGYKTTTTLEDVINDFKATNSLWNAQGIQFELLDIVKSKGNAKSLKKDLKWVKEKYLKTLQINSKKGTIKSDESKKVKYWQILHKLIKGTTNRNKNAINLFYVPYLPGQFMCGVAYSYSAVIDSRLDSYKRKNAGYAIIGEQSVCESGKIVAHELGHMFSLGHKETTNVDLMMWGDGERINSWQANKIRKYHNKYLKRTLALN
jgi:hypothetical protein